MPTPILKPLILNPYSLMLALWLGLTLVSRVYPAGYLVLGVIILTAVIPFILAFIWLARSNVGAWGARLLEKWTWRVLLAIVLFFYAIFAKQWAAVTINHIFHVDPSYLAITSLAVAAFYLPLQVLYNITVILPLWIISLIIGVLLTYAVIALLCARTKFRKVLILAAAAFAFVYATNFFFAMIVNIVRNRDVVITQVALWADFNSDHLCTDAWASASDSVLFLGGDWVLAHNPHAASGERLKPVHCDFARSL